MVLLILLGSFFSEQRIMNRRDSWEKEKKKREKKPKNVSDLFSSPFTETETFYNLLTWSITIKIIAVSYA